MCCARNDSSDDYDFYLASSEGYGLLHPRRCRSLKRLASDNRDDLLLISIQPPILGQPHGLGAQDIDQVIVAPRHLGSSLFPISEWPIAVHVVLPLINLDGVDLIEANQMRTIGWAELYRHEKDALAASR